MLESNSVFSAKFPSTETQVLWFSKLDSHSTTNTLAKLCACSPRTICDWKRAKFSPQYDCITKICETFVIPLPKIQKVSRYAHLRQAGKKGGDKTTQKYGKPQVQELMRAQKWRIWWNTKGHRLHTIANTPLNIERAQKSSELAEFIGIMMGDGTMSTYHIGITLHASDDAEYASFVVEFIKNLFGVHPKVYKRKEKNAIVITVARKLLVAYLHKLGLPMGNKIEQNLDIPSWITKNSAYAKACVRGLMDTDGSVFTHTYTSKGKKYSYKKVSFTSASPALLISVHNILSKNDISSHISKTNLRIDSRVSVDTYFTRIGTHNTKHLKRLHD